MKLILIFALVFAPISVFSAPRNDAASVSRVATISRAGNVRTSAPQRATTARSATPARTTTARSATPARATTVRSAMQPRTTARSATISRAATTISTAGLSGGYNACRDSYFTCMDQFCATRDEKYRRCICSSRMTEIRNKEKAIANTTQQLQDFADINLDSISKTSDEIRAMQSASVGESAIKNDTSASGAMLSGISEVLGKSKASSSGTGHLDIGLGIDAMWDVISSGSMGADIMSLEGERLYNNVHEQCLEFSKSACDSGSTQNMVVSAYGMYIENDCNNIVSALDKQTTAASAAIRQTNRDMGLARLENYNAHNSTAINECIAQVRKDITSTSACGTDFVKCVDITGSYVNASTGEPIYSPEFYRLETALVMDGDILKNRENQALVAELNRKRISAARGLDTCRDLADDVWQEFMRQAITEIYQKQQSIVNDVRSECLSVVNACYDEKTMQLRDFSNVKEQAVLGMRMELIEQMCAEKTQTCSNLYGGGEGGLLELIELMARTSDQKILKNCKASLVEFANELCFVSPTDVSHAYPYACRVFAPGEAEYGGNPLCNTSTASGTQWTPTQTNITSGSFLRCTSNNVPRVYTSCRAGYYLKNRMCLPCPAGRTCPGGTAGPGSRGDFCPISYIGSLYQKLVMQATQICVKPANSENPLPETVLYEVNEAFNEITGVMRVQLKQECERGGGIWSNVPETNADNTFNRETNTHTGWGSCSSNYTRPSADTADPSADF